jgi:hypothetical protein
VPKKSKPAKRHPLYKQKPAKLNLVGRASPRAEDNIGQPLPATHFQLREDGSIATERRDQKRTPELLFQSDTPFVRLYHGNCLELLDAIADKYPEGRFDAIFADPPYFLSNGSITCHAGKMAGGQGRLRQMRGPELNHEFNFDQSPVHFPNALSMA